jgi:hypothetical protein
VKRINGALLMCHKHLSWAMVSASLPAGPIDRIPEGVRNVGDLSAGDCEHAIVQLDVRSGRAQAVRAVVAGQHGSTVSATFHVAPSALRTWVQRFANQGPQGWRERPRPGRPRQGTCALGPHLHRLGDQDPLPARLSVFSIGAVAHSRPRWPTKPVSSSVVNVSVVW